MRHDILNALFFVTCAVTIAHSRDGSLLTLAPSSVRSVRLPVDMTSGQVWPKPVLQWNRDEYSNLDPMNFQFNLTSYSCDVLQDAVKRYAAMLFLKTTKTFYNKRKNVSKINVVGTLTELKVQLTNPCEKYPSLNMDEKYEIQINNSSGTLSAASEWGILRGLETFSQLVFLENDGLRFVVRHTTITDYPRFRHRGFLLDTSRHYLPLQTILDMLDAMSYSKLNVFHWHIVDDQSFPFQSMAFPSLSEKGAYGPSAIYKKTDIKFVIEYARHRGIRVVPEIDNPGHTLSWGHGGIPGLLTQCSDTDPTDLGPIDPTVDENYNFVNTLLAEVSELFQDQYLHLGGDEVSLSCWSNNKKIEQFMRSNNISNVTELEDYYFKKIFDTTRGLKVVPIVWEELFSDGVQLGPDVVVQIWKPNNFSSLVQKVLDSGHPALVSSCWYLNYIAYGSDWKNFYDCDLGNVTDTGDLFLGGEVCVWGEFVDETNLLPRSWPRASAAAEVLWSRGNLTTSEAAPRLEEHVCRMKRRGIPAQPPNGPSYCPY